MRYICHLIFASTLLLSSFVHADNLGTFLMLSDVHYNPVADNEKYPSGNQDTNKALLDKVIGSAAYSATKNGKKPDFILIAGDFLSHGFEHVCQTNHAKCVQETIEHPLRELWTTEQGKLNQVPIYSTLGNNDTYSSHYRLSTTDGSFQDIGKVFGDYALPAASDSDKEQFIENFKNNLASYIVNIPATCKGEGTDCLKLMVLNTVPFSNKKDALRCDGGDCTDFRQRTVDFINSQSADLKPALVSMHIPDSSSFGWDKTLSPQISKTTELYKKCSTDNPNCIKAIFAGHWHMFSPSIKTADDSGNVKTMLAPSITPRMKPLQNGPKPGYVIVTYSRDTGELKDIAYYRIENYHQNLAGKNIDASISWIHDHHQF